MLGRRVWVLTGSLLFAALVVGCGSSTDEEESDVGEGSADASDIAEDADVSPDVFVEPTVVGEGQPCDEAAVCGDPIVCDAGLECVPIGSGATPYCLQPCALDDATACGDDDRLSCTAFGDEAAYCYVETVECERDSDCDFGESFSDYTCRDLPGGRTVCEPPYDINFDVGDPCRQWGADACLAELCSVNAACVQDACVAVEEVDAGAACSLEFTNPLVAPLVCADSNLCVPDGRDDGFGQCAVPCADASDCEEEGHDCVDTSVGSVCVQPCEATSDCEGARHECEAGVCRVSTPLTALEAFEECSVNDWFYPEARYCRNDRTCYSPAREPSGICLDQCSVPANDCPLEGDACARFSGNLGACLPTCVEDTDCAAGSVCQDYGDTRHCRLPRPSGPRGLGETCDATLSEGQCQPELSCLRGGADTSTGVCSAYCTVGADDCPVVGGLVGECVASTTEPFGLCTFFCEVDEDCPAQLGCEEFLCIVER